jgi:hypothetical protein
MKRIESREARIKRLNVKKTTASLLKQDLSRLASEIEALTALNQVDQSILEEILERQREQESRIESIRLRINGQIPGLAV